MLPKEYQDVAPLIFFPKRKRPIRESIEIK
jgi:hypothetical protein